MLFSYVRFALARPAWDGSVYNVDVVFDAVGGATLQRSWAVLAPGGRVVTIADDAADAADERTKQAFFIVEPNREQLVTIGALLDAREIDAFVDAEVPFFADCERGRTCGLVRVGAGGYCARRWGVISRRA